MNKLKLQLKSDKGNAVLIMSLAIFGLILLIAMFMVDANKNVYMQNNYTQMAQRATQSGLTKQNSVGGLTSSAITSVVDEYLNERNPGRDPIKMKSCGPSTAKNQYCQTNETTSFRSTCSAHKDFKNYPIMKISFSDKPKPKANEWQYSVSRSGTGASGIPANAQAAFAARNFKSIKLEVQDFGDNYFASIFGNPCQKYNITATSTTISADQLVRPS